MIIRKAETKDVDAILGFLSQVLEIHAKKRPDIFQSGKTKYTKAELEEKIDKELIFVAEEDKKVIAHLFLELQSTENNNNMKPLKILYIDDICVDENHTNGGVGSQLFDFVKEKAKELDCYEITLNLWEGNEVAEKFYLSKGMKTKSKILEYIIK